MPSLTNTSLLKSLIDAKGDIVVGSADDTANVLTVGTNNYYLKANSSASFGLEWASVSTGVTSSSTAPATPSTGSLWFNQDTAQTFVYYDSQWIEIGASGMAAVVSASAPGSPITGQIWYNSDTGGTYVYYNTIWVEVGAAPFNYIMNTINAKGDLLVGTADNAITGVTVGANGQVLTANSSTASGVSWATPTVYASTVSPTFTGTVVLPSGTSIGSVTSTEVGYLSGVTSAIQTQLTAKATTGKAIAMAIVFGG